MRQGPESEITLHVAVTSGKVESSCSFRQMAPDLPTVPGAVRVQ